MKPKHKFTILVKKNRQKLVDSGININTVRSWMYNFRIPSFDNAIKLSYLLDLPISQIPYRKIEINKLQ